LLPQNNMLQDYIKESIELQGQLLGDAGLATTFEKIVAAVTAAFVAGNKVLAAGNGGSAADAQHFTAEFMGKYKLSRRAYPAIALNTDTSIITAWSNDNSYDEIFKRQIEGIGKPGDVLFVFSTSGNSKNILLALAAAKKCGITAIAFLGRGGGAAKGLADLEIIIPSDNTPRIQEAHKLIYHSVAEEVEKLCSVKIE
jgi:D-sedoheptulose 7-phosphate isomerase